MSEITSDNLRAIVVGKIIAEQVREKERRVVMGDDYTIKPYYTNHWDSSHPVLLTRINQTNDDYQFPFVLLAKIYGDFYKTLFLRPSLSVPSCPLCGEHHSFERQLTYKHQKVHKRDFFEANETITCPLTEKTIGKIESEAELDSDSPSCFFIPIQMDNEKEANFDAPRI